MYLHCVVFTNGKNWGIILDLKIKDFNNFLTYFWSMHLILIDAILLMYVKLKGV